MNPVPPIPRPDSPLVEWALWYAAQGWPVFPCTVDKKPRVKGGFKSASTETTTIESWWSQWPDASIGCPTGPCSGFWVLDIDLPAGPTSLADLEDKHGTIPDTLTQTTGSGGRHYLFPWPEDRAIRNSAKQLAPGIDVRGDGGYIILPPSNHPDGNAYAWNGSPLAPLHPAPQWLLDLTSKRKRNKQPKSNQARKPSNDNYGAKALKDEAEKVCCASEGIRNDTLNQAAFSLGQLVAGGVLSKAEVENELSKAALAAGLPQTETQKTIASGLNAGMQTPRQPAASSSRRPRTSLAFPFILREDGVYHLNSTNDGTEEEFLCSPLRVLAHARNNDGQSWGRLLEVQDSDGNLHRWAMPMNMTAGSGEAYRSSLLDLGLRLAPGTKNRNLLQTYITQHPVDARARCVPRIGWHHSAFVLPDEVFGHAAGEQVVLQAEHTDHAFRVSGSMEQWQEGIGRLSEGNSRLTFAISTAFAAPLLEPLGLESGGFHFVGGSSIGKTTILEVAGSVCGGGGISGFTRPWRTTDNALEGVAANHCDSLLCLDEIGQVAAKVAGDIAYMLANGQGKTRARKDGTSRKPQEWRTLFLSSGELTLADKIREDGNRRVTAGQGVRVVDIPADAGVGLGVFEALHGYADGHVFVQKLKDTAKSIYGQSIRAYLAALVQNREVLTRQVAEEMKRFAADLCPSRADGQVQRVCSRFALVAAAGELAVRLGITPWAPGSALTAARTCFQAWLDNRGGLEPTEVREGLAQVRHFIENHGASRFEDPDGKHLGNVINRAGFRRKIKDQGYEYYVLPETFRKEVCQGFNPTTICKALADRALLARSSEGKYQVNKSIPSEGGERRQTKVYHILPGILGGIDG